MLSYSFKRLEEAITLYQQAIILDPTFAIGYTNLGSALLDLKRPEEAIEQFQKAADLDPTYVRPK